MTVSEPKEGKAPFQIPGIEEEGFTYYKIFGDLSSPSPRVVVLHGGPGAGHEYLLAFSELWTRYGLPVVFYDQIGCASSSHLRHKAGDESFWQESLFVSELDNLLDHLGLRDGPGFHILGQSWGGNLGSAFASSQPRGLKRLVLASALASRQLSVEGQRLLRAQLPPETQKVLDEGAKKGEYDTPEYKASLGVFLKKHLCRVEPFPPDLSAAFKNLEEDKTVYSTMYGPSMVVPTGSLRKWTVIPRLPNITAPTLVYNGEFDTSHEIATVPFFELIPRVRWLTLADAGHMCHVEGEARRDKVLKLVGEFLTAGAEESQ